MAERGKTQKELAQVLDISEQSMSQKMRKGVFRSDELQKIVDYLNIENPGEVFFDQNVTL